VSREMGPDAVILSTRRIRGEDGSELVEVEAALRKDADARTGQSSIGPGRLMRSLTQVIVPIAALALLIIIAVLLLGPGGGEESGPAVPARIAVLPFENLGTEEETYFADGICEEITAKLAQIDGLSVISRTSAFLYRDSEKKIKQIGDELGADYILEGSVRWRKLDDGRVQVRISPQLVRISDEVHVWAEVFEEDLSNIFKVQADIAEMVAGALNIRLAGSRRRELETAPTDNMDAFNFFIRGKEYSALMECTLAHDMFNKAVELDPGFTLAWVYFAYSNLNLYNSAIDKSEERLIKAREALDKAAKLDPTLPALEWALGYYNYYALRDFEQAEKHFKIAEQNFSDKKDVYVALGYMYRTVERYDDALRYFHKAYELSPRESKRLWDIGHCYHLLRRYPEAEEAFLKAKAIAPDAIRPYQWLYKLYIAWQGDIGKAREVYFLARQNLHSFTAGYKVDVDAAFKEYQLYLFERRYQEALAALDELVKDYWRGAYHVFPLSLLRAKVYRSSGQVEAAREAYEQSRRFLEPLMVEKGHDDRYHAALGITLAGLGMREEAIAAGRHAVEMHLKAGTYRYGRIRLEDLAEIYALLGEPDKAIDILDELLSAPGELSVWWLKLDPKWDPLRDNPRFKALLAKGDVQIDAEKWRVGS
ncbi:MAG TPA: tetratricopeptide repeat protein, partial [Acidobacteriota bacterium]|nr:tetratricopeptide repeat protein [Acidobacteriota bacterium]